jgi:hypothetical protein
MKKTFELNKEMMKLMAKKAMYVRPKLSRREQEHKRDSSMRLVYFGGGYKFVKVHLNQNRENIKGCEYLSPKYRYAEPRKRR